MQNSTKQKLEKNKNSDETQCFVNKFQNDGTFLQKILLREKIITTSTVTKKSNTTRKRQKSVKSKKQSQNILMNQNLEKSIECSMSKDPILEKSEKEFLCAMKIMEDAGLITEKGIGAGMVK